MDIYQIAENLWRILDDIDSTSELAGRDDKAYRRGVENLQKKRFLYGEYVNDKIVWK